MRSEKRRRRRGLLALLLVLTLIVGILPADMVQADDPEGETKTLDLNKVSSDYSNKRYKAGEKIHIIAELYGTGYIKYYCTGADEPINEDYLNGNAENTLYSPVNNT